MSDLRFREERFWSIVHGGEAVRVAIFDERGKEHSKIVPMARPWVKRRDEVIAELERELDHRA